jgi:hypothetical protein
VVLVVAVSKNLLPFRLFLLVFSSEDISDFRMFQITVKFVMTLELYEQQLDSGDVEYL